METTRTGNIEIPTVFGPSQPSAIVTLSSSTGAGCSVPQAVGTWELRGAAIGERNAEYIREYPHVDDI